MADKPLKKPKIPVKNLNKKDILVCKTVQAHPDWNDSQVGSEMVRQGKYSNSNTIYKRLKQSQTLGMTVKQLREYHLETFIRDNVPTATKNVKKALKDKQFKEENRKDFYRLSLDVVKTGLSTPDETIQVQQQINIGAVQNFIAAKTAENSNSDT